MTKILLIFSECLLFFFFCISRFDFNELFEKFEYPAVRQKILTRQMKTSPFLAVLWRIFLHCLPRDSAYWNQAIDASRDHYDELVNRYLLDVGKIREHNGDSKDLNHPLSQAENVNQSIDLSSLSGIFILEPMESILCIRRIKR
jgi:hypothetical protein